MKIKNIYENPIELYPYWVVESGKLDLNGNHLIKKTNLPILFGYISEIEEIEAIIATSDLQGVIFQNENEYLLGEAIPEYLSVLIDLEFPFLNKNNIGVLLCGDLYANSTNRGGKGDVKSVWREFKKYFKWVAGVAGNHDFFGTNQEFDNFKKEDNIYFIDGELHKVDNLILGGIIGIIGRPDRPFRKEANEYTLFLKKF